jgi:hypothetical protein
MSHTDLLIIGFAILQAVLILTLDSKLWAKLDRVVNIIILERQEILRKIEGILTRIEEIEKRLKG